MTNDFESSLPSAHDYGSDDLQATIAAAIEEQEDTGIIDELASLETPCVVVLIVTRNKEITKWPNPDRESLPNRKRQPGPFSKQAVKPKLTVKRIMLGK